MECEKKKAEEGRRELFRPLYPPLSLFFPAHSSLSTLPHLPTVVEPHLWEISIQGTSPSREHRFRSRKNVHIIFVSVTSIEERPLFREKGHLF